MDSFRPQEKEELFWEPGLGFDLVGITGRALISRKSRTESGEERSSFLLPEGGSFSPQWERDLILSAGGGEKEGYTCPGAGAG